MVEMLSWAQPFFNDLEVGAVGWQPGGVGVPEVMHLDLELQS
ncbi:hypothetical protein ACFFHJ_17255 [Planotetraspora thailandica]|nr:hypothetical protein [Planotetraspora thailandica]